MSSPPSLPSATFKIGNSVSGVSSCGDPFGGVVYAVDDTLGLAVLRAPGDIQNSHHVQIINCDANTKTDVKVLNSVSPPPNSRGEEEERAALPVIDKGRQERRFETAVKAAQFVAGTNAIRSSLDFDVSFDRRRLAFFCVPPRAIVDECTSCAVAEWNVLFDGVVSLLIWNVQPFGDVPFSRAGLFVSTDTSLSLSLSLTMTTQTDNIGENVTEEAQEIFDALARTLPCRWKNQEIIVLDEISIPPPYTTPAGGDELFRERIKNVLVHERRRLGMS